MFASHRHPKGPYKRAEYEEARRLRRERGMPMKQIAAHLGVSPGTVHLWTNDIEISSEQAARNNRAPREAALRAWTEINRGNREAAQAAGRARARQGDPFHQACCMLYWAEGSKGRNGVVFANSDAEMVRFFTRFLTESLGVDRARIVMHLNVYLGNGMGIEEIEDFWLEKLGLPRSSLRKHILDHYPTSSSGGKRAKLPYGVCNVKVHSTELVQHIYGAIQEYGCFEEPRWLDGPPRKPKASKGAGG